MFYIYIPILLLLIYLFIYTLTHIKTTHKNTRRYIFRVPTSSVVCFIYICQLLSFVYNIYICVAMHNLCLNNYSNALKLFYMIIRHSLITH